MDAFASTLHSLFLPLFKLFLHAREEFIYIYYYYFIVTQYNVPLSFDSFYRYVEEKRSLEIFLPALKEYCANLDSSSGTPPISKDVFRIILSAADSENEVSSHVLSVYFLVLVCTTLISYSSSTTTTRYHDY